MHIHENEGYQPSPWLGGRGRLGPRDLNSNAESVMIRFLTRNAGLLGRVSSTERLRRVVWVLIIGFVISGGLWADEVRGDAVIEGGGASVVTGVAIYRERIALPPGAVFEATLQDIARAGAPATVIGRVRVADPMPPIRFSIPYDPADISPRGRYAVRGTIHVDGQLRFTSDTIHPVLRHEGDTEVEILLRAVGGAPRGGAGVDLSAAGEALPAHGLRLPATFRGDLPCADCDAIRHHLDLWPDQVFHLRREWLGKETESVDGDMGRWRVDSWRNALVLQGGREMPLEFEILGPDRLRLLDIMGQHIESDLPYELESIGRIEMAEIPAFFLGHMTYMADSPRFAECLTGRSYSIAPGEEALKMQREYVTLVDSPGGKLMMHFEGVLAQRPGMEGDQSEPTWAVKHFIAARPDGTCPQPVSQASLTNTYWRITSMLGEEVEVVPGRREPHIVLREVDGERRFTATIGCNQLIGAHEVDGASLRFSRAATTLMACPPPLAEMEQKLRALLEAVRGWRIADQALTLQDEGGAEVARLQAVYF
jgi:copper homeostasis protein (lipoprotein)